MLPLYYYLKISYVKYILLLSPIIQYSRVFSRKSFVRHVPGLIRFSPVRLCDPVGCNLPVISFCNDRRAIFLYSWWIPLSFCYNLEISSIILK